MQRFFIRKFRAFLPKKRLLFIFYINYNPESHLPAPFKATMNSLDNSR